MNHITLSELERLQQGIGEAAGALHMDQDSFRSLYERTARPLWVFIWRKTGDSQLADDLLQETYYRFLRTRNVFESDDHRKNYLFRIATNLATDTHRRKKDHEPLPDEIELPSAGPDSRMAEVSQRRTDLDRAMAQLKPSHRDALWLAYAEGSSHEEIASVLGLKVQSVKLILFRARRKLAQLMRGKSR